jgi:hypothetical protein
MFDRMFARFKELTTLTKKDAYTKAREKYVSNTGAINVWALKPYVEELLKTHTDEELAKKYYAYQGMHWKGDNMERDALMIAMMARTRQESGPIDAFILNPEGLAVPKQTTYFHRRETGFSSHDVNESVWTRISDGRVYVACPNGHVSWLAFTKYAIHRNGIVTPDYTCRVDTCSFSGPVSLKDWTDIT